MSEIELNDAARDVIEAGREGTGPNEFVAARVRRAVDRALVGSVPPARRRNRMVPILVVLGFAALGGALYATELVRSKVEEPPATKAADVEPVPSPRHAAPRVTPPEPPSEATTAPPVPASEAAPESTHAPASERPSAAPSARSQRLAAEIALLARVNAAVNAGDGARALELLGEYDRTFKPAILGEERAAASVLALCAAGRTADARAAAKRFSSKWERSPLSGRIAKSCAGTQ